jgi:hypothetical protein
MATANCGRRPEDAVSFEPKRLPRNDRWAASRGWPRYAEGRELKERMETLHGGSVSHPIVAGGWFSIAMTRRSRAAAACR